MQLEAYHTPKDKAAVLVAAHKVAVGAFAFAFAFVPPLLGVITPHRWTVKAPTYQAHTRERKGEIHRTISPTTTIRRRVERDDKYQLGGSRRRLRWPESLYFTRFYL